MAPRASPTAISPNFMRRSNPQRGSDLGHDGYGDLRRPPRPDGQADRAVDAVEIGLAEPGSRQPFPARPLRLLGTERPDIEAPGSQRRRERRIIDLRVMR